MNVNYELQMNGGQKQNGSPSSSNSTSSKHNPSPSDSKDSKQNKTENASNHQNNKKKISLPEKFLRGPGKKQLFIVSYYRQISADIKMKIYKIETILFRLKGRVNFKM